MTHYRVTIDQLTLHGVPPELAEGIGPAVEARLSELAGPGEHTDPGGAVSTTGELADQIAGAVWRQMAGGGAP